MAYRAKLPVGGLRAAVEAELAQGSLLGDGFPPSEASRKAIKNLRGIMHRLTDETGAAQLAAESEAEQERFKTVRVERQDYVGADASAGNCPVSRAIRRALGKAASVSIHVWVDRVRIGTNLYALPEAVTEADRAFTSTGTVTELEFQLSNRKVTA